MSASLNITQNVAQKAAQTAQLDSSLDLAGSRRSSAASNAEASAVRFRDVQADVQSALQAKEALQAKRQEALQARRQALSEQSERQQAARAARDERRAEARATASNPRDAKATVPDRQVEQADAGSAGRAEKPAKPPADEQAHQEALAPDTATTQPQKQSQSQETADASGSEVATEDKAQAASNSSSTAAEGASLLPAETSVLNPVVSAGLTGLPDMGSLTPPVLESAVNPDEQPAAPVVDGNLDGVAPVMSGTAALVTGAQVAMSDASGSAQAADTRSVQNQGAVSAQRNGKDLPGLALGTSLSSQSATDGVDAVMVPANTAAAGSTSKAGGMTADQLLKGRLNLSMQQASAVGHGQSLGGQGESVSFDSLLNGAMEKGGVTGIGDKMASPALQAQNQKLADNGHGAALLKGYSTSVEVPLQDAQWGEKIAGKMTFLASQRVQIAQIHINPADLGPIEVRIHIQQDQANVTLHAQHAIVRELLESNAPRLRDMLQQSGLNLAQLDVSSQSQQESQQRSQQQSQQDAQQQSSGMLSQGHGAGAGLIAQLSGETVQTGQLHLSLTRQIDLYA